MASVKENQELNARYDAAVAQVRKTQQIEQGQAGALVYAALAYGSALEENSLFAKVSHIGKLVCIAAVFVIPNLLVIHVLL